MSNPFKTVPIGSLVEVWNNNGLEKSRYEVLMHSKYPHPDEDLQDAVIVRVIGSNPDCQDNDVREFCALSDPKMGWEVTVLEMPKQDPVLERLREAYDNAPDTFEVDQDDDDDDVVVSSEGSYISVSSVERCVLAGIAWLRAHYQDETPKDGANFNWKKYIDRP